MFTESFFMSQIHGLSQLRMELAGVEVPDPDRGISAAGGNPVLILGREGQTDLTSRALGLKDRAPLELCELVEGSHRPERVNIASNLSSNRLRNDLKRLEKAVSRPSHTHRLAQDSRRSSPPPAAPALAAACPARAAHLLPPCCRCLEIRNSNLTFSSK